jgi:hypothetical protein
MAKKSFSFCHRSAQMDTDEGMTDESEWSFGQSALICVDLWLRVFRAFKKPGYARARKICGKGLYREGIAP